MRFAMLQARRLPVPRHLAFASGTLDLAKRFIADLGAPVVVKPLASTGGTQRPIGRCVEREPLQRHFLDGRRCRGAQSHGANLRDRGAGCARPLRQGAARDAERGACFVSNSILHISAGVRLPLLMHGICYDGFLTAL